ncbi:gluconokinase [Spirabiliibacterium falconis]|uniref:gluconokinase n=1 Tax=Spirabiliibacterium falconis TaxID=572023 RepID=UPI001AACB4A9|nr:gluconokinase [Spirabiliibacterium falconis]MBE2894634.1 gluconokinase [Spirabiliibacterium falconis]
MAHQNSIFILMGVSSTGKTSVGTAIANKLKMKLIDGDDLHPKANILKMRSGLPLNDQDREPWLVRIRDAAFSLNQKSESGIIVCSALKKQYRNIIRDGNPFIRFIFLSGSFELILDRMKKRQGHYMKTDMLRSQFDTLEVPQSDENDVDTINIDNSFDAVVADCISVIEKYQ